MLATVASQSYAGGRSGWSFSALPTRTSHRRASRFSALEVDGALKREDKQTLWLAARLDNLGKASQSQGAHWFMSIVT